MTATVGGVHDVIERDVPIAEAVIHETSAAFGEAGGTAAVETVATCAPSSWPRGHGC